MSVYLNFGLTPAIADELNRLRCLKLFFSWNPTADEFDAYLYWRALQTSDVYQQEAVRV